MAGLLDFLQSASNTAASNVSAPVDLIAWLLKKGGVNVGTPVGGSEWMAQKGLTKPVQQSAASLAGETAGLLAPMVAAAKAPQIAGGLLQGMDNLAAPRTLNPQKGAIVWHGSPHKFDKFDSSKIGTGEGAQAYGHGLYLAENPKVAAGYKDALSPTELRIDGQPIASQAARGGQLASGTTVEGALMATNGNLEASIRMAKQYADQGSALHAALVPQLEALRGKTISVESAGNLYKVDLPDEAIAKMLDWDKPLSQQTPEVYDLVSKAFPGTYINGQYVDPANSQLTGRSLLDALASIADKRGVPGMRAAEPALRQAGIPGIRYLDGGSRGTGSGTSNFVVFPGEEQLLKILERNGVRLGQ